jgi:hypothetical protein
LKRGVCPARSFPSFHCTWNVGLVEPAGFPRQSRGFSQGLLKITQESSEEEQKKHVAELEEMIIQSIRSLPTIEKLDFTIKYLELKIKQIERMKHERNLKGIL